MKLLSWQRQGEEAAAAAAAQLSSTAQLGGNRFLLTNLETSVISRSVAGAVGGNHGCPLSLAAWAVL